MADLGVCCSAEGTKAGGNSVLIGRMSKLLFDFRADAGLVVEVGDCSWGGGGVEACRESVGGISGVPPKERDMAALPRDSGVSAKGIVTGSPSKLPCWGADSSRKEPLLPLRVGKACSCSSYRILVVDVSTGTPSAPAMVFASTLGLAFTALGLVSESGIAGTTRGAALRSVGC